MSLNRLLVVVLALLLSSCGGFNKILKSTDNELKYNAALKYYNKKDFARSNLLFEQLVLPFEGTERDDTVNFYLAKGSYMAGDIEADTYLRKFCTNFGRSIFAEEAFFLKAINLYETSLRYELDQSNTMAAIAAFNEYNNRFTNHKYKDYEKYVDELELRLEKKAYFAAKLYYQIEDYKAAIVALRNSVREYPESPYKEEQMFLILKSSYQYAKHSVKQKQPTRYLATIDEYYNFLSEYPESKYTKEAKSIYNDAIEYTQAKGLSFQQQKQETKEN